MNIKLREFQRMWRMIQRVDKIPYKNRIKILQDSESANADLCK